jgi:hypothetical protein
MIDVADAVHVERVQQDFLLRREIGKMMRLPPMHTRGAGAARQKWYGATRAGGNKRLS